MVFLVYLLVCVFSKSLNVVPNPPRTLLARLKFLEDHLVKLEKEYPPWAALHFNQPGRGVCVPFI